MWKQYAMSLMVITLLSCGSDSAPDSPIERNWFYEHEFDQDDRLRVRPHQIVILDLQPGDGFEPITHSIPYEYTQEGDYTFCKRKKA